MASKQLIWAMKVKAIMDAHYVPESERDCCKAIWQRWVLPVYPICLNTFYIWMRLAVAHDGYLGNGQNRVYKNKFAPQLRLQGESDDIKRSKNNSKVIFGGRRIFIQRCQGKITKEEYRLKRLSPIESNGEANHKGNRFFELTSDLNVIFKPNRKTHISLELQHTRNYIKYLKKLFEFQESNPIAILYRLDLEHLYICFDETLFKTFCTEQKQDRVFAIDLNPNYVGWSVVDWKSENEYRLVDKGVFSLKELNDKFFELKGLPSSDKKKIKLTNKRTHEVYVLS